MNQEEIDLQIKERAGKFERLKRVYGTPKKWPPQLAVKKIESGLMIVRNVEIPQGPRVEETDASNTERFAKLILE